MGKTYFTLTGTKYYYGKEFLEPGTKLLLEKEPDNEYDKEAILVTMEGLGKLGYVANSPYTVLGESMSAGRIYDKIGNTAEGSVLYVLSKGVLCVMDEKNIDEEPGKNRENDDDDHPEDGAERRIQGV